MCLQMEYDNDVRAPRAAAAPAHPEGRVRVDGLDPAWGARDVRVCFPLNSAFDHNYTVWHGHIRDPAKSSPK